MCRAHRLLLSTSEISDATASMPSPGYFALQHRVAPPRKAYSLTRRLSSHSAHSTHFPFSNRFLEVPLHHIFKRAGVRFRNVLEAALDDGERAGKRNAVGEEQRRLRLREELRAHVPEPRERLVGFREGSHVSTARFSRKSSAIDAQPAEARSYSLSWSS